MTGKVIKGQLSQIGAEDIFLSVEKKNVQRFNKDVLISGLCADNIPFSYNKTIKDKINEILEINNGISSIGDLKDYIDLGIHPYRTDIFYPVGSAFLLNDRVYLVTKQIDVGTPPDATNTVDILSNERFAWNKDKEYLEGDICTYNKRIYIALIANTNSNPAGDNRASVWVSQDSSAVLYYRDNLLCVAGNTYIVSGVQRLFYCLRDCTGISPLTYNHEYWAEYNYTKIGTEIEDSNVPMELFTEFYPNALPYDGRLIEQDEYKQFTAYIKSIRDRYNEIYPDAEKEGLSICCDETAWDSSVLMKASKFVIDDNAGTIRMKDVRPLSPFTRYQGDIAKINSASYDAILDHAHYLSHTTADNQSFGYGNVAEGANDADGVRRNSQIKYRVDGIRKEGNLVGKISSVETAPRYIVKSIGIVVK